MLNMKSESQLIHKRYLIEKMTKMKVLIGVPDARAKIPLKGMTQTSFFPSIVKIK